MVDSKLRRLSSIKIVFPVTMLSPLEKATPNNLRMREKEKNYDY